MADTANERSPSEIVRLDLNSQVYAAIKDRLLTREFGGGQKISLQTLADQLGVSRSPVHHALTRLVTEGLVVSERRGYVVRAVTVELIEELHEARLALELHAAELTAGRLSPAELGRFRELMEATVMPVSDHQIRDVASYAAANRAFHEYQVDLAGNATMSEMYRRLCVFQLQERALLARSLSQAGESTEQHQAIVAAFEKGDAELARKALRANAETGKEIMIAEIKRAGGVL
jgi:DNA-binding GntR family transcriptional regulator